MWNKAAGSSGTCRLCLRELPGAANNLSGRDRYWRTTWFQFVGVTRQLGASSVHPPNSTVADPVPFDSTQLIAAWGWFSFHEYLVPQPSKL